MTSRTGKKAKKPLQTTLGKAAVPDEKEVDLSHVQKPIHTSVFGLRQVLSLFQTATEEVQNYITYECDIMYECRTCRTIFRSLANFILHKRSYCRERFSNQLDLINNNQTTQQDDRCSKNLQDKTCIAFRSVIPEQKKQNVEVKKDLAPVIERLKKKQEIQQLAQKVLNEDLSSKEVTETEVTIADQFKKNYSTNILLEEIATNNAAVFQTMIKNVPQQAVNEEEYMKSEVMEIHGILENDEAVLGSDGKIFKFQSSIVNKDTEAVIPKREFICPECNVKFSTKKTLTYHIKYKHNSTRLVYICPDCKDSFANVWCVYRHLYKIHRKTLAQIKRMRDQINNSCVRRDQEPDKKNDKKVQERIDKTDEENQWLNNIEGDNDFQMCGGCGKRFERKAALHSHAQMCTKRIAVCNTIKENNAKKKEEEYKENKNKIIKIEKPGPSEMTKGSSKRKPYLLRTYKPRDKVSFGKAAFDDVCDVNANCENLEHNRDSQHENEEQNQSFETKTKEEIQDNMEYLKSPALSTQEHSSFNPKISSDKSLENKVDTKKLLNIIGVSSLGDDISVNSGSEENSECRGFSNEHKSHTAIDFDLFCQRIAQQLVDKNDREIDFKKTRPVPLILRRGNTKSYNKNCIKDNLKTLSTEINKKNDLYPPNATSDNTNITNVLHKTDSEINIIPIEPPGSSSFRISVKNLEDLIGVSSKDCGNININNIEIIDIKDSDDNLEENIHLDPIHKVTFGEHTFADVSETIRANVSPEKVHRKLRNTLKRKRTASFDSSDIKESLKQYKPDSQSQKQDVNFLSKASPYMDQCKLQCIPCQSSYSSLTKLLWHMSAHFSWFRFQCSRCSFISFNKTDCANHARKVHNVKKRSITSVVLPIPNWKTVLMSQDFHMLKDENDLSGKHTDEILFENQEETTTENSFDKKNNDDGNSDCDNELFVDFDALDLETEDYCDYALNCDSIKDESINDVIDIVDDNNDSFQIEVPEEIYTLDLFEIINGVDEERFRLIPCVKTEAMENDEEAEKEYYIPQNKPNDCLDMIKEEVVSDEGNIEDSGKTKEDNLNKKPDCVMNIRPTRNRMRSRKTLQDDFFYDLSKVIKLNDSSQSKLAIQKNKKNSTGTSTKNGKDSVSSNSKDNTKSLRVYSKKK